MNRRPARPRFSPLPDWALQTTGHGDSSGGYRRGRCRKFRTKAVKKKSNFPAENAAAPKLFKSRRRTLIEPKRHRWYNSRETAGDANRTDDSRSKTQKKKKINIRNPVYGLTSERVQASETATNRRESITVDECRLRRCGFSYIPLAASRARARDYI